MTDANVIVVILISYFFFFFQAEDGIRDYKVTGVQTCALPISYNEIPHKFEAGTPNVEGAVGLAAAITYLEGVGLERIAEHEQALAAAAIERLAQIEGVTVYGPRDHREIGRAHV